MAKRVCAPSLSCSPETTTKPISLSRIWQPLQARAAKFRYRHHPAKVRALNCRVHIIFEKRSVLSSYTGCLNLCYGEEELGMS